MIICDELSRASRLYGGGQQGDVYVDLLFTQFLDTQQTEVLGAMIANRDRSWAQ